MANCEYCNYYKNIVDKNVRENNATAFCSFANAIIFLENIGMDSEYPCRNISYQEYLDRLKITVSSTRPRPDDWKMIYKSRHLTAKRDRSKNVV